MEVLKLPNDGTCEWAGMEHYELISPSGEISAVLEYVGEPPHGDSYHTLEINGQLFPGYAWGSFFGSSEDSKYLVCSWMEQLFEKNSINRLQK